MAGNTLYQESFTPAGTRIENRTTITPAKSSMMSIFKAPKPKPSQTPVITVFYGGTASVGAIKGMNLRTGYYREYYNGKLHEQKEFSSYGHNVGVSASGGGVAGVLISEEPGAIAGKTHGPCVGPVEAIKGENLVGFAVQMTAGFEATYNVDNTIIAE